MTPQAEVSLREGSSENAGPSNVPQQGCRVALYSHDTMGIGHMRRNLLIAQALISSPLRPTILMIAGAREAGAFPMPSGVDCLTLPSLFKQTDGSYQSRGLDISLERLIALRAETIRAALTAFEPDVLIVDKVSRGVLRELDPTLQYLRAHGRTRCILGLRDVLDDPETVGREWRTNQEEEAIRAYYDAIWVYGDRRVYDPVREYALSAEVAAKVCFTGYLDRCSGFGSAHAELTTALAGLPPCDRFVLCMVGGGQDGARLAEAFALAAFPEGTSGVILMGPFMPAAARHRLRSRAAGQPQLHVLDFVTDADLLLSCADRVIGMGGYNTVCEVLAYAKPALIVPRVKPRREQLIRAERLRDLGLLDMLHPDKLSPHTLSEWIARGLPPLPEIRNRIDLNGLARLPQLLESVLGAGPSRPKGRDSRPAGDDARGNTATGRGFPVTLSRQ
jgi:predicted glycosyltransferase